GMIVGIKSLLDAVRIIAAHVCVNAAQLDTAGTKVNAANESYYCLNKDYLKLMMLKNYYCSRKYSK
ncbi:hypothetical protein Tco_0665403, partial [Tanacetum coccineum]